MQRILEDYPDNGGDHLGTVHDHQQLQRILEDYPDDGPSRFLSARADQYRSGARVPDDPRIIRMDVK